MVSAELLVIDVDQFQLFAEKPKNQKCIYRVIDLKHFKAFAQLQPPHATSPGDQSHLKFLVIELIDDTHTVVIDTNTHTHGHRHTNT